MQSLLPADLFFAGVMDDDLMDELMENPGDAALHAKGQQTQGKAHAQAIHNLQDIPANEGNKKRVTMTCYSACVTLRGLNCIWALI